MSLNDYVIQRAIGSGTYGRVYLATSKEGLVALKIIDPEYTLTESATITKEFELGQRIGKLGLHTAQYLKMFMAMLPKNPIFPDKWREKLCLVIVMTFIPGQSMTRYVEHNYKHRKMISPEQCLPFLVQTSQIVRQLHRFDFIHGDLNLGNIIIANGQYHLIDLGGAGDLSVTDPRRADCVRLNKIVTGPLYMLPVLYRKIWKEKQAFVINPDHDNVANYMKANDVYAIIVSGLILLNPSFLMQKEALNMMIEQPLEVGRMFNHYRRYYINYPLTDRLIGLLVGLYQQFHTDDTFYLSIEELHTRFISLI